ncbi:MAG: phosphotransferase [Desulfobacterales bacterium]|nr:phosphotransferase [Desulfobacterales bacterium]
MNSEEKNTFTTQEDVFRSNRHILSEHYDIGLLVRQERIYRGYINESYKIEMLIDGKKSRYLMRLYRKGTPEKKVRFEHTLLHELQIRRFKFSPRLISTKGGKTYVRIGRQLKHQARKKYIAVFSFLPDEDKYSWDTPLCSDEELRHSAKILTLYHNTIFGWQGTEGWGEQSNIDVVSLMATKWKGYVQNTAKSPFDEYFLEQVDDLLNMLSRHIPPQQKYHAMPRLAVHGDYHPGNLKFKGGKVTGVFDFGWSKIDARCFDVGLAIMYFCTTWENNNDGILQLDRVENFLGTYQETANKTKTIGSFNKLELEYLPHMIHMGNLIVVDWILNEFYRTGLYPEQYLKYLQHSMSLNRWLDGNWEELTSCIQRHST